MPKKVGRSCATLRPHLRCKRIETMPPPRSLQRAIKDWGVEYSLKRTSTQTTCLYRMGWTTSCLLFQMRT
ncbi:hypothetical protein COCOBI_13-1260 [Coccomyxa sp. Obi]|nr:hypothetical protein COCOBI_13-1260 [Coccomyxa sp. Obi]